MLTSRKVAEVESEMLALDVSPEFSEPQGSARSAGAPTLAEHVREESGGEGTAEVVASFAPVEAVANRRGWRMVRFSPGVPVSGEGVDLDSALEDLIEALREYAADWNDRLLDAEPSRQLGARRAHRTQRQPAA